MAEKPVYIHCKACGYEWIWFFAPIPLYKIPKPPLCIHCHADSSNVFIGRNMKDLTLIEETDDYTIYAVKYDKGEGKAILCKTCDRISYNSNDVDQKFCPCKGYHKNRRKKENEKN